MELPEKEVNVNFPEVESAGERPWGVEEILCIIPDVLSLKRLLIKKGSKGGLQYHRLKNECGILISGKMAVRYVENKKVVEKIINAGETFHFPPMSIHQEEALEDSVIIEASTPHFNDRVRVEEFFGMGKPEGLPSTTFEQIINR